MSIKLFIQSSVILIAKNVHMVLQREINRSSVFKNEACINPLINPDDLKKKSLY
jgi:hypothetical protein